MRTPGRFPQLRYVAQSDWGILNCLKNGYEGFAFVNPLRAERKETVSELKTVPTAPSVVEVASEDPRSC